MTEGHSQFDIYTEILQFNSTFAVWQWTLLFLCDSTLFDRFLVQKWPSRCELINKFMDYYWAWIYYSGKFRATFFLILASRTECTVHTKKNSSTLYWTTSAHNKNQYLRQCTGTYPVVRIILVKFALNNTHNNGHYLNTMVDTDALLCE